MRSHRLDLKTMDQFRVTNKREGAGSGRYIYTEELTRHRWWRLGNHRGGGDTWTKGRGCTRAVRGTLLLLEIYKKINKRNP